jgi:hypothetical protein
MMAEKLDHAVCVALSALQDTKRRAESKKRKSGRITGALVTRRGRYDEYTVQQDPSRINLDGGAVVAGQGYFKVDRKGNGHFKIKGQKLMWDRERGTYKHTPGPPPKSNSVEVAHILHRVEKGDIKPATGRKYMKNLSKKKKKGVDKIKDQKQYFFVVQVLYQAMKPIVAVDQKKLAQRKMERGALFNYDREKRFFTRTHNELVDDWRDFASSSVESIMLEYANQLVRLGKDVRVIRRESFADAIGPTGMDYVVLGRGQVAGTDKPDYTSDLVKRGVSADSEDGSHCVRSNPTVRR